MVKVDTPHTATQTVNRVVGDVNRFLFGVIGQDDQHRTENFFAGQGVVRFDTQHGGMHKIAFVKRGFVGAACDKFCALLQTLSYETQHTLTLRCTDQRA